MVGIMFFLVIGASQAEEKGKIIPFSMMTSVEEAKTQGIEPRQINASLTAKVVTETIVKTKEELFSTGWNSALVEDPGYPNTDLGYDHSPGITVDGSGALWYAYSASQGTGSNRDTVYIFCSLDGGNTWQLRILWYSNNSTYGIFMPTISANTGDNYVYLDAALGQKASYTFFPGSHWSLRFQHTGGGNVADLLTVQVGSYTGYVNGSIAADGTPNSSYVHLIVVDWVWDSYAGIHYYRSSDRGASWTLVNQTQFSDWITSAIDASPKSNSNGAFFGYWRYDGSSSRTWVAEATSTSFSGWTEIDAGTGYTRWPVRVAWNGTNRIAIWEDWVSANNSNIFYRYNTGSGWSARMTFDASSTNFISPDITIDNSGRAFIGIIRDENNDYWGHPALFTSTDYTNWTPYHCYSDSAYDYDYVQEYNGHGQFIGIELTRLAIRDVGGVSVPAIAWRRVSGASGGGDPWFSTIQISYGTLVAPNQTGSTLPGTPIDYTMQVTNTGLLPDTFLLSSSGTRVGWTAEILDSTGTNPISVLPVNCQATRTVILRITPPDTVLAGVADTTYLVSTSSSDPTIIDSARAITTILGFAGLVVEPDTQGTTTPGVSVDYSLRVINNGNVYDTVNLNSFGTSPNWTAQILDSTGTNPVSSVTPSPYGGISRIVLRITPPDTIFVGSSDTTVVQGVSSFNPSVSDSATVITEILGFASLVLEPDTLGFTSPGVPITYNLRVINNGNVIDTVNLTSSGTSPNWTAEILDTLGNPINSVILSPYGDLKKILLRITPPDTVVFGSRDTTTVTGISSFNPAVSDNAVDTTEIGGFANLVLEPDTLGFTSPGVPITYNLRVINNGNVIDTVNLTSSGTSPNWTAEILDTLGNPINSVILSPYGDLKKILLRITPPDTVVFGSRDTTIVTGTSLFNPSVSDNATLITEILGIASLRVDPDTTGSVNPGNSVDYPMRIINNGNATDSVSLSLASFNPPGWTTQLLDTLGNPISSVVLAPYGDLERVILRVYAPSNAGSGDRDSSIVTGTSSVNPTVSDNATVITVIGLIANIIVDPNRTGTGIPDDIVQYRLWVQNLGNATDVIDLSISSSTQGWALQTIRDRNGNPLPDNNSNGKADITLAPGQLDTIEVWVQIPPMEPAGMRDTSTVLGESNNIPGITDQAMLVTTVEPNVLNLIVDPDANQKITAGTSWIYPLWTVMEANSADTIDLNRSNPPPGWSVEIQNLNGQPIQSIYVQPQDTGRFQLKVTSPEISIIGPRQQIYDSCVSVVTGISRINSSISDIATLTTKAIPRLDVHNYASPFKSKDGTNFIFSLPERGKVSLWIYNRLGERVITLIDNEEREMGIHEVPWNGKNSRGHTVVPGVYIYLFKFEGPTFGTKVIQKKTAVYGD